MCFTQMVSLTLKDLPQTLLQQLNNDQFLSHCLYVYVFITPVIFLNFSEKASQQYDDRLKMAAVNNPYLQTVCYLPCSCTSPRSAPFPCFDQWAQETPVKVQFQ